MRGITAALVGLTIVLPLATASVPARADNDFLDQAKRFLGNNNNDQSERNAYERGREDEMRHQRADQDWNRRYRRSDQWSRDDYSGDRDVNRRNRDGNYR